VLPLTAVVDARDLGRVGRFDAEVLDAAATEWSCGAWCTATDTIPKATCASSDPRRATFSGGLDG